MKSILGSSRVSKALLFDKENYEIPYVIGSVSLNHYAKLCK